jgi:hypothetical protein
MDNLSSNSLNNTKKDSLNKNRMVSIKVPFKLNKDD